MSYRSSSSDATRGKDVLRGLLDDVERLKRLSARIPQGLVPRETTSAWSGGPPASPGDQDKWNATNVDGNDTRWTFQYHAASASPYKWVLTGGPPVIATAVGPFATTSAAYADLPSGPSFTPGRAGEYEIGVGAQDMAGTVATAVSALASGSGGTVYTVGPAASVTSSGALQPAGTVVYPAALTAGAAINVQASAGGGGGTLTVSNPTISILPRRIA